MPKFFRVAFSSIENVEDYKERFRIEKELHSRIERGDHVDQKLATNRSDEPEALLQNCTEIFRVVALQMGDRICILE